MRSLHEIALFDGIGEETATALAARCRWHRYEASEVIIDYEEASDEVRFILSGRVRILLRTPEGKEVILADLGPQAYFGEMAALDGSSRSANVTALEPCDMCLMPAAVFREALHRHPAAAHRVMQSLVGRVRDLNLRLSEHTFMTSRQRLCAELIRSSRPRAGHPDQRIVSPPPLHRTLADRIGTQREVITRELSALKRCGIVEPTRGGLVLLDPARLHAMVRTPGKS